MGILTHNQDTATLVEMMKISYYPVIFCFFTLISHKNKIPWMTGGEQPIPAGLSYPPPPPPQPTFLTGGWLWILLLLFNALTTINKYIS